MRQKSTCIIVRKCIVRINVWGHEISYGDMIKGKGPILWGLAACTISTEIENRISVLLS